MFTLEILEVGLVIFLAISHLSISGCPSILAPLYNTSIDLDTLSKFSLSGGSKVSDFSKAFTNPLGVSLILNT